MARFWVVVVGCVIGCFGWFRWFCNLSHLFYFYREKNICVEIIRKNRENPSGL